MRFELPVGGLQKLSTIDFPGKLACVLFLQGCNMDCFYCHNRNLLRFDEASMAETDWLGFLKKRSGLLEGVVVTGGEPLIHENLPAFLACLKGMGYAVKLDTNGLLPQRLASVLEQEVVDFVALDMKALPDDYPTVCKTTRQAWDQVLDSLDIVYQWDKSCQSTAMAVGEEYKAHFEVRTTLYPGFDSASLINLASRLPVLPAWRLNLFRQPELLPRDGREVLLKRQCLTIDDLYSLQERLLSLQPNVFWK